MNDIETRLAELAAAVFYPPTPDFTIGLRDRLAAPPRRPARASTRRLTLALVAIAVVVLAALAYPPSRDSIARFFGIRGVSIEQRQSPPASPPAGLALDRVPLGPVTSRAEAERLAGFPLRLPATAGTPDELRVRTHLSTEVVSAVYIPSAALPDPGGSGVGMLLTEFRARVERELFAKVLGPSTTLEEVSVDGVTGYWLAGSPHEVVVKDVHGDVSRDTLRLAENTLLWQKGDVTYRIESALPRDEVLRIAASLR